MWNSARFVAFGGWVGSAGKAKCGLASSVSGEVEPERVRGRVHGRFFRVDGVILSVHRYVREEKRSVILRVFTTCVFRAVISLVEMPLLGGARLGDSRLER